jgi:hypothetical protein
MERARIVGLPAAAPPEAAVMVRGDHIVIDGLALLDAPLARFLEQRPAEERGPLVERALRIGLLALQDAGAALDVDVVRREFEAMVRQAEAVQERAAMQLDIVLRQNFADGDGRLPRTMEAFLGDRGRLRTFVQDLFDEERRDSAIGRLRQLLGTYFDGDASRLALLLDPTRLGSPLHQFRTEVTSGFERLHERLSAIEAAAAARSAERARSSAKGADFEELVAGLLADAVRGTDHVLERTTDATGDVLRSRKGDFLITLEPQMTRGTDLRLVVECKDRRVSARAMREEIVEARRNRDACVGIVVFSAAHAPAGIAPFDVRMGDVYCVIDPQQPDLVSLEVALRLARLLALATLRTREVEVDVAAVRDVIERIRAQLDAFRGLKMQLTTIGTAAQDVSTGLDRLRAGILAQLQAAELELRPERLAAARAAA